MAIPTGYFRRLTNAYKDSTGRIRWYGKGESFGAPTPTDGGSHYPTLNWLPPLSSDRFKDGAVTVSLAETTSQFGFRYADIENNPIRTMQPVFTYNGVLQRYGIQSVYSATCRDSAAFSTAQAVRRLFISPWGNNEKFKLDYRIS